MQIILLIAGLILLLAGPTWFTGAATVGLICVILFAVITVIQVIGMFAVAKVGKNMHRDFRSRF